MGPIWTLALKDLKLVLRDRFGLFWMLVFPLLFALFFGFLTGGGGENRPALPVAVIDEDQTDASRALVERLKAKKVPDSDKDGRTAKSLLDVKMMSREEAEDLVRKGKLVAYILIPRGGGDVTPFGPAGTPLEVGYDPRRSAEIGFLQGVLMETVYAGFQTQFTDPAKFKDQMARAAKEVEGAKDIPANQKLVFKALFQSLDTFVGDLDPQIAKESGPAAAAPLKLEPVISDKAHPLSAFEVTFPSAVMWGVMGCVTTFAISLVLERMQGTFLRLQVAPASWGQLLAGKGLACFLACCSVALILLLLGRVAFGVRLDLMRLPLLALGIGSTAVCFTGMMMFVSTLGKTPAGVAGAGWGLMMPMAM